MTWTQFLDQYYQSNSGIDPQGILLHVSAQLLERHICIVTNKSVQIISGESKASAKPRIWMYLDQNMYTPLFKFEKKKEHPFTSSMLVKNDVKYMSKDRVFEALKSYVNSPKKHFGKLTLKITGYMSKVIRTEKTRFG